MIDEYYTFKIFGYHAEDLKPYSHKRIVAVCDECYLYRTLRFEQYRDICISCANKHNGIVVSKTNLAPKEPLPDGWESKLSDITGNKSSPVYLGSIAEVILSRVYDNVQVMPYGNHGFDVICNRDYKIDIKSSATGDKLGFWMFAIKQNQIADYFLCIAFNSRDDLYNPAHLWLIPADKVNHLIILSISKSTLDKWQQYELPLDKLVACCDNLSDNAKEVYK